jgi:hypothetical protein
MRGLFHLPDYYPHSKHKTKEKMKDLFGNEIAQPTETPPKVRKSVAMHARFLNNYGITRGRKCKDCIHFFFRSYSKKYPKCAESGLTGHTQNHDWSSTWQACGKFEPQKTPSK